MDVKSATIDELNSALEEKLVLLRKECAGVERERETVIETARRCSDELNEILYGIIGNHAPQINAVQIQINADVDRARGLPKSGGEGNRYEWKDYVQLVVGDRNLGGKVPFLFTAHLPFEFTTGTHGSGERAAMGASIENILFEIGAPGKALVNMRLCISEGYSRPTTECYFLSEEVESVKLTQITDQTFSQVYRMAGCALEPSPSAVDHYLFFKGFAGCRTPGSIHIPESKWKSNMADLLKNIRIPNGSTGLLNESEGLLSGFAVVRVGEEFVLYEFDKVNLPNDLTAKYFDENTLAYVAYAIDLHSRNPQKSIKVYKGDEIITRLHECKTDREF